MHGSFSCNSINHSKIVFQWSPLLWSAPEWQHNSAITVNSTCIDFLKISTIITAAQNEFPIISRATQKIFIRKHSHSYSKLTRSNVDLGIGNWNRYFIWNVHIALSPLAPRDCAAVARRGKHNFWQLLQPKFGRHHTAQWPILVMVLVL